MSVERRGFASMPPDVARRLQSAGGKAAHAKGTAHRWTSEEARAAGRRGGIAARGGRGKLDPVREQVNADYAEHTAVHHHDPHDHELSRFADEGNPHHD